MTPGGIVKDMGTAMEEISLDDPRLYINRELSWLKFNRRVLEEAEDHTHPLLERVKFLAICGSNLDEFFMSRVPGLQRQAIKGALEAPADGMTPSEQLEACKEEVDKLLVEYSRVWYDQFVPDLREAGIHIHRMAELSEEQRARMRRYFEENIFPILTPLAIDVNHPFPFISSLAINLAVVVRDRHGREKFARVKVPCGIFPRFVRVDEGDSKTDLHFVMLEDIVASNLDMLFAGMSVVSVYPFRATRDAEIEIELDETSDLLTAVEEGLESRRVGQPVRLEVDTDMPESTVDTLAARLELPPYLIYRSTAPLALVDLWQLHGIKRPDLHDVPFLPYIPKQFSDEQDVLTNACAKDTLLYHPYDSFQPLISMVHQAAVDPDVMAIKITLYRIDSQSPIVEELMEARRNGKAVAAVVELKAKFDETANISWARQMEHAGVHVAYGPVDLKVHAKLLQIVRRTRSGIVRICHISSGNYNSQTARIYGDIGYITCDEDIGADVSDLFNTLTGYSRIERYRKLLVSPGGIRAGLLARIEREIARQREHGDGYLGFKLNALIDKEMIQALYRASMAGVKVDLNVRGMCCLRPGIPGVSDNIRVISIVSRFLEHARIYYFRNGGEDEVLLGSSDLMPRNLNRRVEVLFPVQDEGIRRAVVKDILETHLRDNVKARELRPDGTWVRVKRKDGEPVINSQEWLIANRGIWHGER